MPHRNRDHRAFGAVRLVHSSIFPTTSRTQEGFTVDEAYAAILAMEVNGELAVLADLAAAL